MRARTSFSGLRRHAPPPEAAWCGRSRARDQPPGGRIAHKVADAAGRKIIVAGSVGPTGNCWSLGRLTPEGCRRTLWSRSGLKAGGASDLDRDHVGAWQIGLPREPRSAPGCLTPAGFVRYCRPHDDGVASGRYSPGCRELSQPRLSAPIAVSVRYSGRAARLARTPMAPR